MKKCTCMACIFTVLMIVPLLLSCAFSGRELPVVELSLWGSEIEQELLEEMAADFSEQYKDEAEVRITVCEESEGTCRDTVVFSPEDAADVYAFADDQLSSLVGAGALADLESERSVIMEASGGEQSAAAQAVTFDGKIYAFPMTASNGYFLYYDSSYFTQEDVRSMDRMLDKAASKGKKVCMDLTSGWYLYSFFRAAGLDARMGDDPDKNICDFNATGTDIKGVDVASAIAAIAQHPGFVSAENDELLEGIKSGEIIAAVSGTWNESEFRECYGEGYNTAILPCFTVAGSQIQMHSVMGYKLLGVNAHSPNADWAKLLARWLTNEDNQLLRFREKGEGPADVRVAAMDEIGTSRAIAALTAQSAYGHLQRVAPSYWDPMHRLGVFLMSGIVGGEELQDVLDSTVKEIEN